MHFFRKKNKIDALMITKKEKRNELESMLI